jgi:hypothetical protein
MSETFAAGLLSLLYGMALVTFFGMVTESW